MAQGSLKLATSVAVKGVLGASKDVSALQATRIKQVIDRSSRHFGMGVSLRGKAVLLLSRKANNYYRNSLQIKKASR
jgi:hypothetical protein